MSISSLEPWSCSRLSTDICILIGIPRSSRTTLHWKYMTSGLSLVGGWWKAGLKRSVNASMTRIVFVLKQKHTGVNIALHLRRMARIHTTASRVSHILSVTGCKLVGVLVLMQTDCSDRSVYYSTTRAIVCRTAPYAFETLSRISNTNTKPPSAWRCL